MNCEGCGAPLRDGAKCEYCGRAVKKDVVVKRVVRCNGGIHDVLEDVRLEGNGNIINSARRCDIIGDGNIVNAAEDCTVKGHGNIVHQRPTGRGRRA